jgi:hypothetical protein
MNFVNTRREFVAGKSLAPCRFVVTGCPRTGSNLLITGLEQSPRIEVYGEVFCGTVASRPEVGGRSYQNGEAGDAFLTHLFSQRIPRGIHAIGFKWFGDQMRDDEAELSAWKAFREDKSIRVIFLDRLDWVAMVVSRIMAEKSDIWAIGEDDVDRRRCIASLGSFEIPVPMFEEYLQQIAIAREMALEDCLGHPQLDLTYEGMVKDYQGTLDRVADFLEVPRFRVQTRHEKMNRKSLSERVTNLVELRDYFRETSFGRLFEEAVSR